MDTAISTITEIRKALDTCTTVYVYSLLQDCDYKNPWSGYVKTTKTEIRSLLRGWDRNDTILATNENGALYLG